MKNLETIILQNLIKNEKFARAVRPFLVHKYFQGEVKECYDAIYDYFGKYNTLPTQDALVVHITDKEIDDKVKGRALQMIPHLFEDVDKNLSHEWLMEHTEKFCQDRAMTIAILDSVNILQKKDPKKRTKDAIRDLVSDALAVSFDKSVGHDYYEDAQDRYDYLTGKSEQLEKIPFLIDKLNGATNGGVETKTLNVLMGGTGGGKSMSLCSLSADYLRQGYDVLYITLEMADFKIAQRIDANLLNTEMNDIKDLGAKGFEGGLKTVQTQTRGRLVIKEFPAGTANANHLRSLLQELRMKKKFEPKIIMIDYLNIMSSTRYKPDNMYQFVKGIAEEVRSLAQEENLCIWSATQINRENFGKTDVDADGTSESFGLPYTVDLLMALYADENMQKMGKMQFTQASKNRYEDINKPGFRRFFVGCNRAKMTLYNLEEN